MSRPTKEPVRTSSDELRVKKKNKRDSSSHRQYLLDYQTHYQFVGRRLLRAVMRAMATVAAAEQVNEVLASKFGLDDVAIKMRDIEAGVRSVLSLELARILVEHSQLSRHERDSVVGRIIRRAYPQTFVPTPSVASPRSPPITNREEMQHSLESLIRREMQATRSDQKNKRRDR